MSRFPKKERLNSQKRLQELVTQGHSLYVYPFKVLWLVSEEGRDDFHLQIAFSVPKRKFKRAVHRNRIKRKMREAFRLQKDPFKASLAQVPQTLSILLIYTPKKEVAFSAMSAAVEQMLGRLKKAIHSQTP